MQLYGYWRSSAAYRVRIALNLKGLEYEQVPVDLRRGDQRQADYASRNPQALVPYLQDGDFGLSQSLAIIEYLDERWPEPPLLPRDALGRARAREIALAIACDIHPLNNLRVRQYVKHELGEGEDGLNRWYQHWVEVGFRELEPRLRTTAGRYCVGAAVSLADICLVPQVANARMFDCDLEPYPTIRRIDAASAELPAFDRARPEVQPDAPSAGH